MSVQDVRNSGPAIESDATETMATLGDGISFLADVLGVLGLGGVAQLVNKFQGKIDPVEAALADLRAKMDAALHFEAAHDEDEHMFHVNDVIKEAATNWRTLNEVAFDLGSGLVDIPLFEQNTSTAANELALKDIYWVRPFYDGLVYRDGWVTGVDPPIDHIGNQLIPSLGPALPQVFDYRLTIPTFLYAIQIRIGFVATLRLARPNIETDEVYQRFLSTEVKPITNRLSSTYDVIVQGLVMPPVPDKNHDAFLHWGRAASPGGAVDTYAGFGLINQIGTRFIDLGSDLDYQVFRIGFQVNNLLQKKRYYSDAGLGGIWQAIQGLRPLLGQTSDPIDVNASLSLREISDILGTILIDDPSQTLQFTTALEVAVRLTQIGQLGNLKPLTPVSRPLSLRGAIAAAVSQLTLLPQGVPTQI
jgi:hypothetical protein